MDGTTAMQKAELPDASDKGEKEAQTPDLSPRSKRSAAAAASASIAKQYALTLDIEDDSCSDSNDNSDDSDNSDDNGDDDNCSAGNDEDDSDALTPCSSRSTSPGPTGRVNSRDRAATIQGRGPGKSAQNSPLPKSEPVITSTASNEVLYEPAAESSWAAISSSDLDILDDTSDLDDPDATLVDEPLLSPAGKTLLNPTSVVLPPIQAAIPKAAPKPKSVPPRNEVLPNHRECFDAFMAHFKAWKPTVDKRGRERLKYKGGRMAYMMSIKQVSHRFDLALTFGRYDRKSLGLIR
jgi:hypothetical protein